MQLPDLGLHSRFLTLFLCTVVPSAPGRVLASRNTKTSVVVQWDRAKHEEDLLGYYVDCCVAGSSVWEPCNHKPIGYNRCGGPGLAVWEGHAASWEPRGTQSSVHPGRRSCEAPT